MLVTVHAEPCVGCDAILVQDTKSTKGLVARVIVAAGFGTLFGNDTRTTGMDEHTWRKQMYERSSTSRGLRDHARRCGVG